MTTGAKINVPFTEEDYYVSHDGYPSAVVPYLRKSIREAKQRANEGEGWMEKFELKIRRDSEDPDIVVSKNRSKQNSYEYKVETNGKIFYRDLGEDQPSWNLYKA
jgi:hypothetical protein